ncbi:MAG TPA: right-handed parallel beta-helix repeat-containing protein [Pyrinomonadaceae bacterium]|nr:right-handed parallel beta-helix repeat-containing protein [Pyrinomonadaceae bacterium]
MKRILFLSLIAAGLIATTLFVSSPRSKAMPAACTPTGFFRDGIEMTAAKYNPPGTVTGTLDATGCNIGVYYGPGVTGTIDTADIFGANYFGVVNRQGDVTITDSQIHNIGETPFNGTQHGVAVYYATLTATTSSCDPVGSTAGTIDGNTVSRYQKGGITVNCSGTNVTVTDNTVTGLGRVDFIAQNGIQFGFGASGLARGNTISDNFYTGTAGVGPNPGGQNPPGWEYVSGGLLLYQPGDVKRSNNKYSGNQQNLLMVP